MAETSKSKLLKFSMAFISPDPVSKTISVLALPAGENEYVLAGEFGIGTRATSRLLPDFSVDVSATFAAGDEAVIFADEP